MSEIRTWNAYAAARDAFDRMPTIPHEAAAIAAYAEWARASCTAENADYLITLFCGHIAEAGRVPK